MPALCSSLDASFLFFDLPVVAPAEDGPKAQDDHDGDHGTSNPFTKSLIGLEGSDTEWDLMAHFNRHNWDQRSVISTVYRKAAPPAC